MEQRHVVAPAAGRERVEGRPRLGHARRPQTTMPPPRLSGGRGRPRTRPRARASSSRGSGQRSSNSRMLRAEEAADLVPAGRDDTAERGAGRRRRRAPRARAGGARRDAELEERDGAARPDDARELAQHGGRSLDVAQQVGGGEASNDASSKGSSSALRLDELDAFGLRCEQPRGAPRRASPGSGRRRRRAARLPQRARARPRRCRWPRRAPVSGPRRRRARRGTCRQRGSWPKESRRA